MFSRPAFVLMILFVLAASCGTQPGLSAAEVYEEARQARKEVDSFRFEGTVFSLPRQGQVEDVPFEGEWTAGGRYRHRRNEGETVESGERTFHRDFSESGEPQAWEVRTVTPEEPRLSDGTHLPELEEIAFADESIDDTYVLTGMRSQIVGDSGSRFRFPVEVHVDQDTLRALRLIKWQFPTQKCGAEPGSKCKEEEAFRNHPEEREFRWDIRFFDFNEPITIEVPEVREDE